MNRRGQQGYVLFTVVVMLLVVAVITFLVSYDSSLKASMPEREAEASRADYVTEAAMQHALWKSANNSCMGDVTIPATTLGADSYTAAITGAAAGTAYTLTSDQDAWIRNDDPGRNNGTTSSNHVRFESGNIEQVLTRFDLSTLPVNAQINSATAWFYLKASQIHPEGPITVHEVTANWDETAVTWDAFGGAYNNAVLGMIPAQNTDAVWVAINLTGLVQAWVNGQPNYGILFESKAEGLHTQYMAREDAANPPRLEVVVGSGRASPVTIHATGTLADGNTRSLTRIANPALQPSSTYAFQPDATDGIDAYIWEAQKSTNKGTDDETWVSRTSNNASLSLLKFNMGMIPARAKILSATLSLHNRSGNNSNVPVTAHRITNPWNEAFVTWNNRDSGTAWDTAGGDVDPTVIASTNVGPTRYVRYEWDITSLAQGWTDGAYANYGVALATAMASSVGERFDTSDHSDPTRRPMLTITYACECGTACMAPQGSGKVLMPASSSSNPNPEEVLRIELLESWGYVVDPYWQKNSKSNYDSKIADYDVVYVPATANAADIGTKLNDVSIGVVNELGALNDELGIATSSAAKVGATINISDNSHYITLPFTTGPLDIYSAAMQGVAVAGTPAAGLQTLGDWSGAGSPVVLDAGGTMSGGGTAAGRRVLLPTGGANIDWAHVNHNGRLIMQRALQWGTGNTGGGASGSLLLVVGDAATLTAEDAAKKAIIESWNYTVTAISDEEPQATVDAALAGADVVYIAESVTSGNVSTKYTGATIGVLSEEGDLNDELGFSSTNITYWTTDVSIVDNSHYITETFASGPLTIVDSSQRMNALAGTMAGGIQNLAISGSNSALDVLDGGAALWGGGSATGRRVKLPWATGIDFDINALNANGRTMLKRAIEWGAGAGAAASPSYNVLLIVGNDTTLASKDVGYKALMESWGHTVAVINDGASQAVYDTAMAAADVIYASGSAVGSSMLDKATYTTKGLVNEVSGKIDNFGFSSSKSATATFDAFSSTNASHYITEPFSGDPVTVFTSSLTNPVPGGTLAPDLQNVGQVSSTLVLGTLDAGATRYDSTPSQGRRAHLPFTSAETTDMTADGKTILQRAIEWAAGADSGGGGGTLLLVVGDATNLTTEDAAKKAVIESWNYTVTVISDEESQANIDAALADADVVYITESVTSGTVSTKFTAATIGVLNEEGDLNDDLGMSSGNITYWATDLNITDNSHYITETFAAGPLTIVDLSQRMNALGATMAAGNQNLATSGSNSALDILDSGAALWGGGSATGRRVKLPWATGTDFDINALNANGLTILQRAIEWAAGAGSGGGGGGGGGGGCDGTFRDEFNARSFTGSDGTLTWAGDWLEVGESDGPASGDTQIRTDQSNYQLRTRDNNNGGEGVEREADLTGAASATLSYVYRRSGLDSSSDYTSVEVSANGAAGPWTELTRHQGSGSDSSYQTASHDITSFISANTRVRFITSSTMGGTDTVWFDNVEIFCTP